MRFLWITLLLIGLCTGLMACEEESPSDIDIATADPPSMQDPDDAYADQDEPTPVPDLEMVTLNGETVSLSDYRGEVVVLNFWATWCGPCRVEVPDLIEMQDSMQGEGMTIFGIAVGEDEDQIRPFAEEFQINYPLVPDASREITDSFDGIYGLPTTIVIDPDGQQVERIIGLFSVSDMQNRIEEMLVAR